MESSSEVSPVTPGHVAGLLGHLSRIGIGYLPMPDQAVAAALAATRSLPTESFESTDQRDAASGNIQHRSTAPDAAADEAVRKSSGGPVSGRSRSGAPPVVTGDGAASAIASGIDQPYAGPSLSPADRAARLAEIASRVAGCTTCTELACSRRSTVFGEGDPMAKICFLGEAPGQEEDASGRPFVGRSGELLTKMIEACTLSRSEVYILNVIKCRPPNNRTPDPEEVANCRSYFAEQLQIIRPDYIVCLGLVAARSLLHSDLSVGRLRGRFHRYRDSKVVVTYHPSYLLRTPNVKKEAWFDLQMLMKDYGIDLSQIGSKRPRK